MNTARGKKVTVECLWCLEDFEARVADRERGWGKYCSKACKGSHQKFGGNKPYWEKVNPGSKRSNISKYAEKLTMDDHDEIMEGLSDMDYGASDGGGYESI